MINILLIFKLDDIISKEYYPPSLASLVYCKDKVLDIDRKSMADLIYDSVDILILLNFEGF